MRAIVIKQYGGPEVLAIEERPDPVPQPDQVLVEVKAFGLNHAECYFRAGAWGDVAEITGIECAGRVRHDPSGRLHAGTTVLAMVGGLGRQLDGSYAELVAVPASNVVAVETSLDWARLAALPESYATAWTALFGILELQAAQTLVIRGATSALGQAAVNLAGAAGARVIATTRRQDRADLLRSLGANEVLIESADVAGSLRRSHAAGTDAVLDIVGNTTVLDSLAMLRRGGTVCQVGFLGGGGPLTLEPVFQVPSGRRLTTLATALVTGSEEFPLSEIPFQSIVDEVARGRYRAEPARVLAFDEVALGHQLMEAGTAGGKLVVVV